MNLNVLKFVFLGAMPTSSWACLKLIDTMLIPENGYKHATQPVLKVKSEGGFYFLLESLNLKFSVSSVTSVAKFFSFLRALHGLRGKIF
jgi:hypothetical protein